MSVADNDPTKIMILERYESKLYWEIVHRASQVRCPSGRQLAKLILCIMLCWRPDREMLLPLYPRSCLALCRKRQQGDLSHHISRHISPPEADGLSANNRRIICSLILAIFA